MVSVNGSRGLKPVRIDFHHARPGKRETHAGGHSSDHFRIGDHAPGTLSFVCPGRIRIISLAAMVDPLGRGSE